MALAASAAAAPGLKTAQAAPQTMQHAFQITWQAAARPCTAPARLPPPPRHLAPAALPGRGGMRSRRRPPPVEQDEETSEPRDEMQLWMDRLTGMRPTERSVAVVQLLRIEEEGAFAGLVSCGHAHLFAWMSAC